MLRYPPEPRGFRAFALTVLERSGHLTLLSLGIIVGICGGAIAAVGYFIGLPIEKIFPDRLRNVRFALVLPGGVIAQAGASMLVAAMALSKWCNRQRINIVFRSLKPR